MILRAHRKYKAGEPCELKHGHEEVRFNQVITQDLVAGHSLYWVCHSSIMVTNMPVQCYVQCKCVTKGCKPMFSFGKWWRKKISHGFCLKSFMNSKTKSPVNRFVWNHPYFEKTKKYEIFGMPPTNFTIGLLYKPPSSGEPLPHINLPFKWIVRRCEVVFWCLECECCTFWKIYENSFKSTNTNTGFKLLVNFIELKRKEKKK